MRMSYTTRMAGEIWARIEALERAQKQTKGTKITKGNMSKRPNTRNEGATMERTVLRKIVRRMKAKARGTEAKVLERVLAKFSGRALRCQKKAGGLGRR